MKNVLFVTYYWPPAGGVMMSRIFRFYENLHEYGWNPIILTVKDGDFPIHDSSLVNEILENTIVYKTNNIRLQKKADRSSSNQTALYSFTDVTDKRLRTKFLKFIKFNFIPDTRILWAPFAVNKALEILKNQKIDLIFSSSPPQTNHIIAKKIKSKSAIPWVADLRDPWSDVFWMNHDSLRLSWISSWDKEIEKRTLSSADALVTVTPQLRDKYEEKYHSCHLIMNGYAEKYYTGLSKKKSKNKIYTIIYSGSMSYDQKPDLLFKILQKIKKTNPDKTSQIVVRFIGAFPGFLSSMIEEYDLRDICVIEPYIPMKDLVENLNMADLLFLTGVPDSQYGIIPSKLFDYIATRNPILGFYLDKDASYVLDKSGLGMNFSHGEEVEAFNYVLNAIDGLIKTEPNESFIQSLSRRNQTQQLAQIFDDVWNSRNR